MKPLHAGLLVIGAALAGGLAVRMTRTPAVPVSAQVSAQAPAPAPVSRAKLPPLPKATPEKPAAVPATSAPPPVYEEQPAPVRPKPPFRAAVAKAQPMSVPAAPYRPPPDHPKPNPVATPPAPVKPAEVAKAPDPPKPVSDAFAPRRQAVLSQGMPVSIRLRQFLSTEHSAGGDTFEAVLSDPLVTDGLVIAERGARVTGRVVNAQRAGRASDVSRLELALSTVETADGQRVVISTQPWSRPDDLPPDTVIRFRLASRVTITERPL